MNGAGGKNFISIFLGSNEFYSEMLICLTNTGNGFKQFETKLKPDYIK